MTPPNNEPRSTSLWHRLITAAMCFWSSGVAFDFLFRAIEDHHAGWAAWFTLCAIGTSFMGYLGLTRIEEVSR
jgi:hypothetical protein